MITNEQMEKLWWQYKNEGVAKNQSLQAFCSLHNVPYNAFEKYLKLRRHFSDIHQVTVTRLPEEEPANSETTVVRKEPRVEKELSASSNEKVRIMIHIRMSNGMQLTKKNMDYRELHELVEKLEGLC